MPPSTTPLAAQSDRVALAAKLLTGVKPAEPPTLTHAELLRPWRSILIGYRRKGFSCEQLSTLLAQPEIGIAIPAKSLAKQLTVPRHHHAKTAAPATAK